MPSATAAEAAPTRPAQGVTSAQDELPPPLEVPFRSELLASLADFVQQWNNPEFSVDSVARVDTRVGVPGSRLLTSLYTRGSLRPSDLATELVTGASNISKLLAHLESLGFVERHPDSDDLRVVRVHLTDSGRDVAEGTIAGGDRAIEHMVADWTDDEIRTYAAQTRRLAQAGRDYVRFLRSSSAEA
jgi:DNA-binding MarR family transcriptional regulator